MHILLICMNGITTSVLAEKMNAAAKKLGRQDLFTACKLGFAKELLPQADAVLLAPQIVYADASLRQAALDLQVPVIDLTEEEIALQQADAIYARLLAVLPPDSVTVREQAEPFRLDFHTLLGILWHSFLEWTAIGLIGFVFLLLHQLLGWELFEILYNATLGIVSLYALALLGMQYGKVSGSGAISCALLCVAGTMMFVLQPGTVVPTGPALYINLGFLPLETLGWRELPFLVVVGLFGILLLYGGQRLCARYEWTRVLERIPGTRNLAPGTIEFVAFLALRLVLSQRVLIWL